MRALSHTTKIPFRPSTAKSANAAGAFEGFNARLTAVADEHVTKARGLAGQIKMLDDPKARAGAADEADFQVDRSIKLISAMLKDLVPAADRAKRQLGPGGLARVVREAQNGAGPMMTDLSVAQLAKLGVSAELVNKYDCCSQTLLPINYIISL